MAKKDEKDTAEVVADETIVTPVNEAGPNEGGKVNGAIAANKTPEEIEAEEQAHKDAVK